MFASSEWQFLIGACGVQRSHDVLDALMDNTRRREWHAHCPARDVADEGDATAPFDPSKSAVAAMKCMTRF
jgi:hypothetical protein